MEISKSYKVKEPKKKKNETRNFYYIFKYFVMYSQNTQE